ncbi:MAG: ribbon-helix-helix protein, CopG family [Desulfobacteraceae bacterium]|nr:ribbon-helix-helix protein, CopG family [Desulfobacteraceae bacterium]
MRNDPDLLKELKHRSIDTEKSISVLIEAAIKALLDKCNNLKNNL